MDGSDRRFVQGDPPRLACLLFFEGNLVTRFAVAHLPGGKSKQIRSPEIGVDPQDKKAEVAGIVGQHLFDGSDIPDLADRFDLDG